MKRLLSLLLALCLLPGVLGGALRGSGAEQAVAASVGSKSGILSIADPTQEQIRAFAQLYQPPTVRFDVEPSTKAPYSPGRLNANYIQQVTNRLNLYRMIAKLPPISINAVKNELAQTAAMLLGAARTASQSPPKPADMDEALYQKGRLGANLSNINAFDFTDYVVQTNWEWVNAYKIREMIPSSLNTQMRCTDRYSFRVLNTRRFLLSPYLQSFGVGSADSADGYNFYFCIANAESRNPTTELVSDPNFDYVAWPPSGNCPGELFQKSFPWSISLNEDRYLVPAVKDSTGRDTDVGDRSGIEIRVTRASDGRVWSFDQNSPDGSQISDPRTGNAAYFCIDKHTYGYGPLREVWISDDIRMITFASNALVFRPNFEDEGPLQGRYSVRVTGIRNLNGQPAELNYEVNFFNLEPCEHSWSEWVCATEPDCTTNGVAQRECRKCHEIERQFIAPLGHDWGEWRQTKPAACTESGSKYRSCGRCGAGESGTIPPLGHDWMLWEIVRAPSCTEDGEKSVVCSRCDEMETQAIPALGHDWELLDVTLEPSCTEDGAQEARCRRCALEETQRIPALGHDWDWGVITLQPSEAGDGERLLSCQRCGANKTEVLPYFRFDDVRDPEKYYYSPVYWAYYYNPRITGGTDAAHFSPSASCKREQVVSFLYAAFHKPAQQQAANPFADVKEGKYYYNAVMWALENGITGGVSQDRFGVGKPCTREQVVTFLWTAAGKPDPGAMENPFEDVKADKYYYRAVLWAVKHRITSGTSATRFGVGKTCTRAQIVTFLYKAMDL